MATDKTDVADVIDKSSVASADNLFYLENLFINVFLVNTFDK